MAVHLVFHVVDDAPGDPGVDVALQHPDHLAHRHRRQRRQAQPEKLGHVLVHQRLVHDPPGDHRGKQADGRRNENGDKNEKVNIPIFGDRKTCGDTSKALSKHIRFRLHNGGNCFEQWSGFNDAIIQRAMFGTDAATSAYRPCLAYLNGEYWGLMALREHYSDYYIKQNYGVDDDNVTMFELKGSLIYDDGDEDGLMYINQLMDFLNDSRFKSSNQTTIEEAFQELTQMIDIDSFIDVLVAQYYCCNWDFVGNANNLKMWRAMDTSDKEYEDGKWRFCLHDLDFAFSENKNYLNKNQSSSYNNWKLVKNCMNITC